MTYTCSSICQMLVVLNDSLRPTFPLLILIGPFMKLILSLLLIGVFAFALFAQQPSPTPVQTSDDVVRISTTLVQVDATVTVKKGKVVQGLTADDFEIYVNGQKQKITNFSFVDPSTKPTVEQLTTGASKVEKVP